MLENKPLLLPSKATRTGSPKGRLGVERSVFDYRYVLLSGLACNAILYSRPLYQWAVFSASSELYSYTLIVPLISAVLLYLGRTSIPPAKVDRNGVGAFIGSAVLSCWFFLGSAQVPDGATQDGAALGVTLFVVSTIALCWATFGAAAVRATTTPLAFLLFMIPLPTRVEAGINDWLQHGTAYVSELLFKAVGTPVFVEGLRFQLPGIAFDIAPECSGIHSSLTLLIFSVLTGHFFLTTARRRLLLAFSVIPLALLRNGFRVFIIGELCVKRGPEMMDSPIHHRGGPLFFAASLVPFAVTAWLLVRSERASRGVHAR